MESNLALANADLDLDLAERVSHAIRSVDVLRGSRARVDVSVTNGHVTLAGVVQSPMAAVEVERAAAEASGASGITSHLVDDATLSRRVAAAVGKDPRTAVIPPGYEVISVFGHLALVGSFTEEQSRALTEVGRSVPGVRSITIRQL
jgi:osmotically-inducible protein OsmY